VAPGLDSDSRSIFRDENVRCAAQYHEHRSALGPFFNRRFATPEMLEAGLLDHMVELFFGRRLEEWFRAQNRQRLGLFFLNWERRFALHLQGANGERNSDAPSL